MKRQQITFAGEKEELLRLHRLLEPADGHVPPWGVRSEGYDLDLLDLRSLEEEEDSHPPPDQEPEPMEVDEEQGSLQQPPPPPPSGLAFPRERDNPATWISDDYGDCRSRHDSTVPPYYRNPDPEAPQYFDDMAEFYLEAARRLPIGQMPKLAGVLSRGGLLLGFNDPVTNIIVNAIYMMEKSTGDFGVLPPGTDPGRHATDRASYVDIARRSRAALLDFMTFYYRNLTQAQAKRYLCAARHDLTLAMALVEWHREGTFDGPPVSPDCVRTKTALQYAATAALLLPDPDYLVRLLASRYPGHLLHPILDDLRRGEQLSVDSVNGILNLLKQPWSLPPPLPAPTPGTFRDADGNMTIITSIGQDLFSTTTVTTRDCVAAFNDGSSNVVTTTTISRHPSRPDDDNLAPAAAYLSIGSDTKSTLRSFLSTTVALQLQEDTNSLKMCLLDTIHGLYIQALTMLPSDHQPRLLRAVLAAGHCYGVLEDPVSNIIINSIWYNARFPHSESPDGDDDIQIKPTPSMTRAESSSLHGLIAILRAHRGVTEQEAVACLRNNRRNLSHLMMTTTSSLNHHSLAAAAETAKHPQPAALVAFLTTLLTPEKRDRLRSLLTAKRALSDSDFKDLNTMIAGRNNDIAAAPVQRMTTPNPSPSPFQPAAVSLTTVQTMTTPGPFHPGIAPAGAAPVKKMTLDGWLQSYVRTKVEELLLDNGRNNPLGPHYKLGVICGMASMAYSGWRYTKTCYHVNFLASNPADVPNNATTSPYECKLFFAELWDTAGDDAEGSKKPPVCCPIQDYHAFPGRCFICEDGSSGSLRIVHPPCDNYFMGHEVSTDRLCAVAEHHADLALCSG